MNERRNCTGKTNLVPEIVLQIITGFSISVPSSAEMCE